MDSAQLKYLIVDKIYDINDCEKLLKIKNLVEEISAEEIRNDSKVDCDEVIKDK